MGEGSTHRKEYVHRYNQRDQWPMAEGRQGQREVNSSLREGGHLQEEISNGEDSGRYSQEQVPEELRP